MVERKNKAHLCFVTNQPFSLFKSGLNLIELQFISSEPYDNLPDIKDS